MKKREITGKLIKKIGAFALAGAFVFGATACGNASKNSSDTAATGAAGGETIKIGIPDDATNGGRAIKLLESAGLIEVDPDAGYTPEIKDVTKYIYNIEIVPSAANTLPSTLDDYGAATINGTYATPAGLIPSKDALITETQNSDAGANPYVNVIVARSEDKDNETYKKIVKAYQTQDVAKYIIGKYQEAYVPAFKYDAEDIADEKYISEIDDYKSDSEGKEKVTIGVCGSSNDYWKAVQKVLDDENAGIFIELKEFDAYNLPNEALNAGDVDLNAFQHKAFLKGEVDSQEYKIEAIGDTLMAPLSLYSHKFKSIDDIKKAAGKK